ncbi:MAG: uracil-DNA glycosylase [Acidimicrobiaceae bacterium]|nr:uracil-DNA glycosylase [Acidimicrobiaceae bacterium]
MTDTLPNLRHEAAGCTRCELYRAATQTVFGEGPVPAQLALVGEQPGDHEDRSGHPFVGPSGELLDRALEAAGIDRTQVYITNAVKHFKWTPRGKRRIHQTPNQTEIQACRPWLDAELEAAAPRLVGLLGAVAAKAVLGQDFRVTRSRGQVVTASAGVWSGPAVATVHPSSILRTTDAAAREQGFKAFVADLEVMAGLLP